jgi:hypothetical protein
MGRTARGKESRNCPTPILLDGRSEEFHATSLIVRTFPLPRWVFRTLDTHH